MTNKHKWFFEIRHKEFLELLLEQVQWGIKTAIESVETARDLRVEPMAPFLITRFRLEIIKKHIMNELNLINEEADK